MVYSNITEMFVGMTEYNRNTSFSQIKIPVQMYHVFKSWCWIKKTY